MDVFHHFSPHAFWCRWLYDMRQKHPDHEWVEQRMFALADQFEAMGDWMVWDIEQVDREHRKKFNLINSSERSST